MASFYDQDLAYIHHAGFGDFVRQATPNVLAQLRHFSVANGVVVDLGCGDGTWLRAATDAGYDGVGVDLSPAFIALARATAPEARFEIGSLHSVNLPKCAAITAFGEVLSYLPSPAPDGPPLAGSMRRFYRALRPGGLLLFDVMVEGDGTPMDARTWRAGDDWAVLTEVKEDIGRNLLKREIVTFRQIGDGYRRGRETHWQRVYHPGDIEEVLKRIGYRIEEEAPAYGDFRLPPRRLAYVCRKPVWHSLSGWSA